MKSLLLILAISLISSCASAPVQHPGALNSFDNTAYDTLISEQAAINQAKTTIAQYPQMKATLNAAIDQYNITENAYKVYHTALVQGTKPDQAALQAQINLLVTNVAMLVKGMMK